MTAKAKPFSGLNLDQVRARAAAAIAASQTVHGFRSATSVVAFCGEVARPDDDDDPRIFSDGVPASTKGMCPTCLDTYRMGQQATRFNPHRNVTADGRLIKAGMRVRTIDMVEGRVVLDTNEHGCCGGRHKTGQYGTTPAQMQVSGQWFTDHKRSVRDGMGCTGYCNHDHWFNVRTDDGALALMNGERLLAV